MYKPTLRKPADLDLKLKTIIHGASGSGKTRLSATWPNPVFLDFEGGSTSLHDMAAQVVDQSEFREAGSLSTKRVLDILDYLGSKEAAGVETIVLDSLTELQEQVVGNAKTKLPDPRQAYGQWADFVRQVMTKLRSMDKHFIVIARTKLSESIEGENAMLNPQISPGAWTNVPALADYGFYLAPKTIGLGAQARIAPVLYTRSSKAWTKTRRPLPVEIQDPTFAKIQAELQKVKDA